MEKILYSISEVAGILGESVVTVRFWSNTFNRFLDPRRNAKGNRQYMKKDIETLKKIHYLTRDCGLSLDAVSKKLSKGGSDEDKLLKIRKSLLEIRKNLEQIRSTL